MYQGRVQAKSITAEVPLGGVDAHLTSYLADETVDVLGWQIAAAAGGRVIVTVITAEASR